MTAAATLHAPKPLVDHSVSVILFLACFVADGMLDAEHGVQAGFVLELPRYALQVWFIACVCCCAWSGWCAVRGGSQQTSSRIGADGRTLMAAEARRRQAQGQLATTPPTPQSSNSILKFEALIDFFKSERIKDRCDRQQQRENN